MTPEAFLALFDRFAEAPGAVAKMRAVIRNLAVTGNLVPHDPNEESMQGRVREFAKSRKLAEYTPSEPPFALPDRWLWIRVEATFDVAGGIQKTPSRTPKSNAFPYLGVGNVYRGRVDLGTIKEFELEPGELERRRLMSGDILVIEGNGSFTEIGRCAKWEGQIKDCVHQNHVIRCRPFDSEISDFVLQFLNSPLGTEIMQRLAITSSGLYSLSVGKIRQIEIPLPPLAEQKRIVAKVDELMALCDRLEAQQQERETRHVALAKASLTRFAAAPTPANLDFLFHRAYAISPDELRKAILTLAIQGKLVFQDPGDGSSAIIIDKISLLRQQLSVGKRAKATKVMRPLDEDDFECELPNEWSWCRLGDLVLDFRYGTSRKCHRGSGGVPVLRIPNIQNGKIDPADLKFTAMPSSEFKELRLSAGDLLLVRSNGSEELVGRSAVVSEADEQFSYAGYLVRARLPKDFIFTPYLQIALSSPFVRNLIEVPIRTTSGVKNINTTELSNLVVPVPPLPEQHRIVAKVDQLMALVDQLETQLAESRTTATRLMDAIVAELTGRTTTARAVAMSANTTGAAAPVAPGTAGHWPAVDESESGPVANARKLSRVPQGRCGNSPAL